MAIHPLAGKPAPADLLIDFAKLEREYYERRPDHHEAMVYWATVFIMTKRLARYEAGKPPEPRWGGNRQPPEPAAQAAA